jgi:mRNA-degrading endonuclease HigB of HigAB toxin-antitoxin module
MMEDKLKKLSTSMDQEISKGNVFTKKDEQHILTRIKQDTKAPNNQPISFIPKLLTAALFSGIIFSSYLYFDNEWMSKPNVHIKKETPVSPVLTYKISGEGSVRYSPYLDKGQLNIKLLIKNETNTKLTKPLSYRITFLNEKLVNAVGTKTFLVEPKNLSPLGPHDRENITKQFVLTGEVVKEDLINAIQVDTISGTKALNTFVIDAIEYDAEITDKEVAEEKKEEPTQEKEISDGEAKQIFNQNLADLKDTFIKSGEKNNWGVDNPAIYEVSGPDFEPYVTNNFSTNVLKKLLPIYYCQCDIGYLPRINQEVRFIVDSFNKTTIEISGIEPASDMKNIGYKWNFKLVKVDNKWKMDRWEETSLEGIDLNLTKDEAWKLLTTESQNATFLKEVQLKGTTNYVFNVIGQEYEFIVAISSSDTTLTHDYEGL